MVPFLEQILKWAVSKVGFKQYDHRTGRYLGRALVGMWGHRMHVFGELSAYVRPVLLANSKNGYFHHQIRWESWPLPDTEPVARIEPIREGPVLVVLLLHQEKATCLKILQRWAFLTAQGHQVLVVHGGDQHKCEPVLDGVSVVHCSDPRLRTLNHTVQRQSYTGVMQAAEKWMLSQNRKFSHLAFFEWDHLPVAEDVIERYLEAAAAENADLLAPQLKRIDGTSHGHWRSHVEEAASHHWPERLGGRQDDAMIFNMLTTGSFWTSELWQAVAHAEEPFPVFQEIALPTIAHHLGYRIRCLPESLVKWIGVVNYSREEVLKASEESAVTIHPVKWI